EPRLTLPDPCGSSSPSKRGFEAIEKELLEDYRFGRQQLIEIWGHASAMAVTKVRAALCQEGACQDLEQGVCVWVGESAPLLTTAAETSVP
uniref:Uncharacterized protein n=1 Tax=Chelonoidis abingdonii TaxID=106734 RepID=A0A8C0G9U1_CHEAB